MIHFCYLTQLKVKGVTNILLETHQHCILGLTIFGYLHHCTLTQKYATDLVRMRLNSVACTIQAYINLILYQLLNWAVIVLLNFHHDSHRYLESIAIQTRRKYFILQCFRPSFVKHSLNVTKASLIGLLAIESPNFDEIGFYFQGLGYNLVIFIMVTCYNHWPASSWFLIESCVFNREDLRSSTDFL